MTLRRHFFISASVFSLFVLSVFLLPLLNAKTIPLWQDVPLTQIPLRGVQPILPPTYRSLQLDINTMRAAVLAAPLEGNNADPVEVVLPLPDGSFDTFAIYEYRMMESGLAQQFPQIRTYHGYSVAHPERATRLNLAQDGFHAMILGSPIGTVYIDPYQQDDDRHYVSVAAESARSLPTEWAEPAAAMSLSTTPVDNRTTPATRPNGSLRTLRLAVAATGEFTIQAGGTTTDGINAVINSVNRINGIYERDLSVRFTLVAGNGKLIYPNPATDPYPFTDTFNLLAYNQTNLDLEVGTGNYDIGHLFATTCGGYAGGQACNSSSKARGVSARCAVDPTTYPFDVNYFAHELGHQLGASHTMNGTTSACVTGRATSTRLEPGSGSTIMAYGGFCSTESLQNFNDDYFHIDSIRQINDFLATPAGSCGTNTSVGGSAITVNAGVDRYIPAETPFELAGSATSLGNLTGSTYSWEQTDTGISGTTTSTVNIDLGNNPLFRSYYPTTVMTRTFPISDYILNYSNQAPFPVACPKVKNLATPGPYGNCAAGNVLPTTDRTLHFKLIVRNNFAGGGRVYSDEIALDVVDTAGPFRVTTANTTGTVWTSGTSQAVTWNVAQTNFSPISCTQVNILLSIDGGITFPTTLASATANDGNHTVTIPAQYTVDGRLKIKCANNIFFDVNDADFTIYVPPPLQ